MNFLIENDQINLKYFDMNSNDKTYFLMIYDFDHLTKFDNKKLQV